MWRQRKEFTHNRQAQYHQNHPYTVVTTLCRPIPTTFKLGNQIYVPTASQSSDPQPVQECCETGGQISSSSKTKINMCLGTEGTNFLS